MLQCVENGLIGLDDPVDSILPELHSPDIITPEPNGTFKLTPAKSRITLRQLITHTSGLAYDAMHPVLVAWRDSRGEKPQVMSGKLPEAYSLPLLFEPGTNWVYGAGLDWAGMLVERLNNTKLATYMQRKLFKPLGLDSSTFRPATRPDILANLAQMWCRSDTGELTAISSPYPLHARNDSGGMGLVTSTSDFVAILQDLLKDHPALLKPGTVAEMFAPQFETETPQYKGLLQQEVSACSQLTALCYTNKVITQSLHKQLTGDITGSSEVSFGLGGLVVQRDVPNLPSRTLTWNGMPNIGWFVNRERGLGGIYVSQVLPPGDAKSVQLLSEFWRELWVQHAEA